jgi:type VI secretion system secreted protein Hcp
LCGVVTAGLLGVAFAVGHGSANGSGKSSKIHDISITKTVDKSSPKLLQACVNGTHFKKAVITLSHAGHTIAYALSGVLISSVQAQGGKGNTTPNETLTLNFTKIEIKSS